MGLVRGPKPSPFKKAIKKNKSDGKGNNTLTVVGNNNTITSNVSYDHELLKLLSEMKNILMYITNKCK